MHKEYHTPRDTADLINVAGMKRIADFTEDVLVKLTRQTPRPDYVVVKTPPPVVGPGRSIPRLGVSPDYSEDNTGMLIKGVSEGGAAAKAGLKEGDKIVEIAGRPVTSVQSYMAVMAQLRRGEAVEVRVERDGKKQTFKVTPQ
jgi:S1-C subfamily serine protease